MTNLNPLPRNTINEGVIPSAQELWARIQLARACLNHGRVDRAELLAILNGAALADLMHRE
ncbi:hypothetical protein JNUCC0626_19830 [Lentzea sp. JNUCC 0626]|uniref:hypothetical protein n=1 Tax=Lentzea sp. JNUCC 0626 TaxID=3367513 RepID=UPI00374A11D2